MIGRPDELVNGCRAVLILWVIRQSRQLNLYESSALFIFVKKKIAARYIMPQKHSNSKYQSQKNRKKIQLPGNNGLNEELD